MSDSSCSTAVREPDPPGTLRPPALCCPLAAAEEEEDVCRLNRSRREEVSMAAKDAFSLLTTVLARLSLNFCKLHQEQRGGVTNTALPSWGCNQRQWGVSKIGHYRRVHVCLLVKALLYTAHTLQECTYVRTVQYSTVHRYTHFRMQTCPHYYRHTNSQSQLHCTTVQHTYMNIRTFVV